MQLASKLSWGAFHVLVQEVISEGLRLDAEGFSIRRNGATATKISRLTAEEVQVAGNLPDPLREVGLGCYRGLRTLGLSHEAILALGVGHFQEDYSFVVTRRSNPIRLPDRLGHELAVFHHAWVAYTKEHQAGPVQYLFRSLQQQQDESMLSQPPATQQLLRNGGSRESIGPLEMERRRLQAAKACRAQEREIESPREQRVEVPSALRAAAKLLRQSLHENEGLRFRQINGILYHAAHESSPFLTLETGKIPLSTESFRRMKEYLAAVRRGNFELTLGRDSTLFFNEDFEPVGEALPIELSAKQLAQGEAAYRRFCSVPEPLPAKLPAEVRSPAVRGIAEQSQESTPRKLAKKVPPSQWFTPPKAPPRSIVERAEPESNVESAPKRFDIPTEKQEVRKTEESAPSSQALLDEPRIATQEVSAVPPEDRATNAQAGADSAIVKESPRLPRRNVSNRRPPRTGEEQQPSIAASAADSPATNDTEPWPPATTGELMSQGWSGNLLALREGCTKINKASQISNLDPTLVSLTQRYGFTLKALREALSHGAFQPWVGQETELEIAGLSHQVASFARSIPALGAADMKLFAEGLLKVQRLLTDRWPSSVGPMATARNECLMQLEIINVIKLPPLQFLPEKAFSTAVLYQIADSTATFLREVQTRLQT